MTESLLSGRWRRMGPRDPDDEIQHIPTWVITADSGSTEWSLPRYWLSTWNGLTHSNLLGWVWLSLPRCTDSETEAQRWLNNLLRVTQPSRARAGTGYRGLSPSPDLLKVGGRFQWVALGATIVNKLRSQGPWELLCAPGCFVVLFANFYTWIMDLPGGTVVKNLPANAGETGPIPGWGRSPGEGNGYPLQYSCLENSMDRGAWLAKQQQQQLYKGWEIETKTQEKQY